jgi:hypothetical protein
MIKREILYQEALTPALDFRLNHDLHTSGHPVDAFALGDGAGEGPPSIVTLDTKAGGIRALKQR